LPDNDNIRPDSLASAVTEVSERVSVLIRDEIELAKAEITQKAGSIARGAAAVAAGAVFGVFAIIYAFAALAWGLDAILVDGAGNLWLGFAIVFGLLIVAALGAFFFAYKKLKVGAPTPQMAIDEAKKIRQTLTSKSGSTS
jgi:uncharacterized small protein (DUF1192 family)